MRENAELKDALSRCDSKMTDEGANEAPMVHISYTSPVIGPMLYR